MTEQELRFLPLDKIFKFTIYHGGIFYGFPVWENGNWYLVKKTSSGEERLKILPEQIEDCKTIDAKDHIKDNLAIKSMTINGNPRFRTLVIIGAGASYDYSFSQDVIRPPLTKDLFENKYSDIISEFSGVESLASQILQAKDIENYFQQQWTKIEKNYNPILLYKLINVQYYLHNLFYKFSNGIDFRRNNYIGFFQALEDSLISKGNDEKALIVSFNYDTILEQSLSRALHYNFQSFDDYINVNNNRFTLFKPHGSWNWVNKLSNNFLSEIGVDRNSPIVSISKVLYEKKISLGKMHNSLGSETMIISRADVDYYFPQLLIPFKSKDSFVMPDSHLLFLEGFLSHVDKIIIIGWKGAEEKFKALLKKHLNNNEVWVLYANAGDHSIQKEMLEVLPKAKISEITYENSVVSTFSDLNRFIQDSPDAIF